MGENLNILLPHYPRMREIWLDQEKSPLLMKSRSWSDLPRKFQNHGSDPPQNDIDHASGASMAIAKSNEAGGLTCWWAVTFHRTRQQKTYARTASKVCICRWSIHGGGEAVVTTQRDWEPDRSAKCKKNQMPLERVGVETF